MLSKFFHYARRENTDLNTIKAGINIPALIRHFENNSDCINIDPFDGGTLGICLKAKLNGRDQFLKTHLPYDESRENFLKEFDILSFLYDKSIYIHGIEVVEGDSSQNYLIMDKLVYPENDFSIEQVLLLIDDYSQKLKNYPYPQHIPETHSFNYLIKEAELALKNLTDKRLISDVIEQKTSSYISLLLTQKDRFTPCICHGDLGPKNIMANGTIPIAIDWEDAFWGVEGYDYLYWLTFFNNRKYYSQEIFGKTPWTKEIDIAIMILVIVLKCELSVRSDSYQNNKMTFDQRIMDILTLE